MLFSLLLVPSALAHEGHDPDACHPGELCDQAAVFGSWGLILLGLLFWLVALLPYRGQGEPGEGKSWSLWRRFQARIGKDTTGWRHHLWPVLGLIFVGLGVATLLDWR